MDEVKDPLSISSFKQEDLFAKQGHWSLDWKETPQVEELLNKTELLEQHSIDLSRLDHFKSHHDD